MGHTVPDVDFDFSSNASFKTLTTIASRTSSPNQIADVSISLGTILRQLAGLSEQDSNIISQMMAKRIAKRLQQTGEIPNLNRKRATLIHGDAASPKWNGKSQDFAFRLGRLETRVETEIASYFDTFSICLDTIDTLPDHLKPRVA